MKIRPYLDIGVCYCEFNATATTPHGSFRSYIIKTPGEATILPASNGCEDVDMRVGDVSSGLADHEVTSGNVISECECKDACLAR